MNSADTASEATTTTASETTYTVSSGALNSTPSIHRATTTKSQFTAPRQTRRRQDCSVVSGVAVGITAGY